jgi:uncharacterized protein YuzE
MKFEFTAKSIASYIEDDVCVVSFANSTDDEPTKYLILSQALFDTGDDDREISIEYGRNGNSVTTEVISASLDSQFFVVKIDPTIVDISEFHIETLTPLSDEQREHLEKIFSKSPTKLTLL